MVAWLQPSHLVVGTCRHGEDEVLPLLRTGAVEDSGLVALGEPLVAGRALRSEAQVDVRTHPAEMERAVGGVLPSGELERDVDADLPVQDDLAQVHAELVRKRVVAQVERPVAGRLDEEVVRTLDEAGQGGASPGQARLVRQALDNLCLRLLRHDCAVAPAIA